jgi:hypothetical protein
MGVLFVVLAERGTRFAPFLMTGILGGFTTFSPFRWMPSGSTGQAHGGRRPMSWDRSCCRLAALLAGMAGGPVA